MTECTMSPSDQSVLATAEYFVATAFRGYGRFERIECPTRIEAVEAAGSLIKNGRPALVYAVLGLRSACTDIIQ